MGSMRRGIRTLGLAAGAWMAWAAAAWAAPVTVQPQGSSGNLGPGHQVVAFSFDVRKIYPEVEERFEQWRPIPPRNLGPERNLRLLPLWRDFTLVQATQLQEFRQAFAKAHQDDREMLRILMPRFDAVFRKYGERGGEEPDASDILGIESSRAAWAEKVTTAINAILQAYNDGADGGDAGNAGYRRLYARWQSQRNEAVRAAALKAGGHPDFSFLEATTGEDGLATFDLPEGKWYFVCQLDQWHWYKPVIVPEGGGRVMLRANEAKRGTVPLSNWTGN